MIETVAELNRVLIAISEVTEPDGTAEYSNVIRQCESIVIEGRLPNHKLSIDFALTLELMQKKGQRIMLTDIGKFFLSSNSEKYYELSTDQKRWLIRMCYLHGPLKSQTRILIKLFSPNYEEKTFRLTITNKNLTKHQEILIEHLVQLNLLIRSDEQLEVNPEYVDTIAAFISEGKGWTEESLLEHLKERKEIGDIAEQLVLEFERNRLKKLRCKVESISIRYIGKLRVDAGYDIDSFNGKTPNLNYDRFIEVKGAKNSKLKFFWSDNEIKIARKLGEKYWIYFQGGINTKTKTAKDTPLLFQNPIETILKKREFAKTPQGIIIEGNMVGKIIKIRKK